MNSGVYRLYWDNAPFFYFGATISFKHRLRGHLTLLRRNKHYSKKLQAAFNQFGDPLMKEISYGNWRDSHHLEHKLITEHRLNPNCCNIM